MASVVAYRLTREAHSRSPVIASPKPKQNPQDKAFLGSD
jgi:hypothetical protein